MAIAGKVAITLSQENDGNWSANVAYDKLVSVVHNNNLYISRKASIGVEPPNNEYWFLALQGFSGEDVENILQQIEDIINGTTTVGNAKQLDGHEAEYFATQTDLVRFKGTEWLGTSILDKALEVEVGVNNYTLGGTYYTANDLPSGDYVFSMATIFKRSDTDISVIVWGYRNLLPIINNYAANTWTDWDTFTTTADLAKYLPLSGGTVGNGSRSYPLVIRGSSLYSLIDYMNDANDVRWGSLGFAGAEVPVFLTEDRTNAYLLLHTGNKPSGTYTGNGDATAREIKTNGIGNTLKISSTQGTVILTDGLGVKFTTSGVNSVLNTTGYFTNGLITLKTTDDALNKSGVTYKWEVL